MTTLISFIVVFGALVFFHEFGHFAVARLSGIKVYEFALGFGPRLVKLKRPETLYSIRAIPLGGFVRMAGMDRPDDESETVEDNDPRSFHSQPLWQRMAVIAAGPVMNIVLAALLFMVLLVSVTIPPTIASVSPNSPAQIAGIQSGDEIMAINQEPVRSVEEIVQHIKGYGNQPLIVQVKRDGEPVNLEVMPAANSQGVPQIGVTLTEQEALPLKEAIPQGVAQTFRMSGMIITSIGRMITGNAPADVAGPIGIVQIVGQSASQGVAHVIWLAALLSINLGLFNLFPIPVLDGGWLAILSVEGLRGRPLSPRQQGMAQLLGGAMLLLLLLFATFKDLVRLDWL